jgi:hypothetical protein
MNKDPYLQFRHSEGLGDVIACILHSKFFSFITYSIVGSEYCSACNKRRQALNILFPLPLWKIFFENYEHKKNDLQKYFNQNDSLISEEQTPIVEKEITQENAVNLQDFNILNNENIINSDEESYILISESKSEFDNFLIKTLIYKK